MGNLQRFDGASLAAAGALSIHVLAEYNPCLLQAWDGLPPKQALHCTHQSQHLAIQDGKKNQSQHQVLLVLQKTLVCALPWPAVLLQP